MRFVIIFLTLRELNSKEDNSDNTFDLFIGNNYSTSSFKATAEIFVILQRKFVDNLGWNSIIICVKVFHLRIIHTSLATTPLSSCSIFSGTPPWDALGRHLTPGVLTLTCSFVQSLSKLLPEMRCVTIFLTLRDLNFKQGHSVKLFAVFMCDDEDQ